MIISEKAGIVLFVFFGNGKMELSVFTIDMKNYKITFLEIIFLGYG